MDTETPSCTDSESYTTKFDRTIFYLFLAMLVIVPLAVVLPMRPSVAKWYLIRTVFPSLAVAWLVYRTLTGRLVVRWSLITVFAIAILAAQCISLINAVNPWLGFAEISKSLGLLAAYLLAANTILRATDRDKLLWGIAVSGSIAALYGIAQRFGYDFITWQEAVETPVERGVSFFGHANFAAHFLVAALPLTAGLFITRRSVWSRVVVGILGLLMFGHFAITGTRGAALGLSAGIISVVVVLLGTRERDESKAEDGSRTVRAGWWKTAVAATLVVIAASAVTAAWRVKESDVLTVKEGQIVFRLWTWRTGIRLFTQHPIFGIGAGNYEVVSPAYWNEFEIKRFVGDTKMSYRVHNEYIETAAEQGVIGLAALSGLIMMALYEAGRIARSDTRREALPHGLGLIAAVIGVAVDCLVNFDLQTPASALLFWVVLGMITHGVNQLPAESAKPSPTE